MQQPNFKYPKHAGKAFVVNENPLYTFKLYPFLLARNGFSFETRTFLRSPSPCVCICVCSFGPKIGTDLCPYTHRTFIFRYWFGCVWYQFIMHTIAQLASCVYVCIARESCMHHRIKQNNTITGIVSKKVIQIL